MQKTTIILFFFISGIAISGTCVGTYDPSNYITSPNYPQHYGKDIDCRWLISSPGGNNLTLSFLDFKTRSSSDILKVYEGSNVHGSLLDTYSGDNTPSPIVSNGNNMYLRFTPFAYTTYRGFRIGVSGKYQYHYTMIKIISFWKYKNDMPTHILYILFQPPNPLLLPLRLQGQRLVNIFFLYWTKERQ